MVMVPGGKIADQLSAVLDTDESAGLTMPRLVLGARMRRLRAARGVSRATAGQVIGSEARLAAMETGFVRSRLDDVMVLCDLYQVEEHATRVSLLELARQSHRGGWWQPYRSVIPAWFQLYLGAEQVADVIRCYVVQCVPDLLQTDAYARAQVRLVHRAAPEQEIDTRVRLRLRRQQRLLTGPDRACLWAIIDEAALRRPVGGKATMFRQLEHLLELNELSNITIQILPFAHGGHAAPGGPITLLRSWCHDLPDMIFLEQLDSAVYPERTGQLEYHRHALNVLATQSAPPQDTPSLLTQMISEL